MLNGYSKNYNNDTNDNLVELNHNLLIKTNNIERMRVTSSGNIGIGNTSPFYKLDISGDINYTGDLYKNGSAFTSGLDSLPGNTRQGFAKTYTASSGDMYGIEQVSSSQSGISRPEMRLFTSDTGTAGIGFGKYTNSIDFKHQMVIDQDGNVGIGTDSPDDLLHIEGSSPILKISNTEETWSGIRFCDSDAPTTQNFDILYSSSNQDLKIRSDNLDNIMCFKYNTGHIGIGSNNPVQLLHIHEDSSSNSYIHLTNTSTGSNSTDGFDIGINSSEESIMWNRENTDMLFATNGTERMVIKNDGKVGIGLGGSSPLSELDVGANTGATIRITQTASSWSSNIGNLEFVSRDITGDDDHQCSAIRCVAATGGSLPKGEMRFINYDNGSSVSGTLIFGTYGGLYFGDKATSRTKANFYTSHTATSYQLRTKINNVGGSGGNSHAWYADTGNEIMTMTNVGNVVADGSFSPFTGTHEAVNQTIQYNIDDYSGLIVSTSGSVVLKTLMNAVLEIELSNTDNDKKVYGVVGTVHTGLDFPTEHLYINALGEGCMWVCNINGDIENGDYITSSTVSGYGKLQNDDLQHNYTVAKITEDSNFDDMNVKSEHRRWLNVEGNIINENTYNKMIAKNEKVYRAKFVSVTYHCG